jgi:hypothetical protein
MLLLLIVTAALWQAGCAAPGPSPEQRSRDAADERDSARRQAEFQKGLPPVDQSR